ncbi:hypothetical protein [Tropicimonas sp.]|uniref:hypothetical protein n=1 Tax=Tropicimonas sp. TaxID=2067044 RepID=UPI003A89BD4E
MTADREKHDDRILEAFFGAARDEAETPSPDLLARVLADAYDTQQASGRAETPPVPAHAPRRLHLAGMLRGLGGWPALAGLVGVAFVGLWIGYNPPVSLDALSVAVFDQSHGLTLDSSLPDYEYLLADG